MDGEVVAVSCVGPDGTGAARSLDAIVAALGRRARLVVTAHRAGRRPNRLRPEQEFIAPEQLAERLGSARLVLDDGTGQLGYRIPYRGPVLRSVRCANPSVARMLADPPTSTRVLTSRSLAHHYFRQLRPGDRIICNGVPAAESLAAKEQRLTVLCCRLAPGRKVGTLLQQNPRLGRVVVCGTGPQRRQLERDFPEVTFTGWVDPTPWLDQAEVSVHWSAYPVEGFWRAPFEAMARGCCVIANRRGDLPYCFDGKLVYYCPTFAKLGQAWRWMLEQDEHRLRLSEASWRAAQWHDERVMQWRWRWLVERQLGDEPDRPSILVAVSYGHTRPDHLRSCLLSLERQTVRPRIIVFHDTSRGDDPLLRDRLRAEHPSVGVVEVDYDASPGTCLSRVRNAVLPHLADSEVIWFVDGDCILPDDAAERIAAELAVRPDGLVVSPRRRIPLQSELPAMLLEAYLDQTIAAVEGPDGAERLTAQSLARQNAWPEAKTSWSLAVGPSRAVRVERLLPYDERLRGWGGEDNEWSHRMLTEGGCRVVLGPTAFHQEHERQDGWRQSSQRNLRLSRSMTTTSMPAEQKLTCPAVCTPRRPLLLVTTVGTVGGGCEKAIVELAAEFGDEAEILATNLDGRPRHAIPGARFVPPQELPGALHEARCVVDDGTGQLGWRVPVGRPFVQVVRSANPDVWEAVRRHRDAPTVYAAESLADCYGHLLKPGDRVIPNGFAPVAELPVKERGLSVLHARLVRKRGVGELLAHNPHLGRVVVCGDGPERTTLRRRFPEVEFPGFVEVDEWLARAEVNLHWSHYRVEGFWRGPAEGVAHGCAVICGRRGDVNHWGAWNTVWMARSLTAAGRAWRRLLTDREHLERLQRVGLELARFQPSEAVQRRLWRWLIERQLDRRPAIPATLVGVLHRGGSASREALALSLRALLRQTAPVRIVLLIDLASSPSDRDLPDWLRRQGLAVEIHSVGGGSGGGLANALSTVASGEPIRLWCRTGVVLAEDAVERLAAQFSIDPAVVACAPVEGIDCRELPDCLAEAALRRLPRQAGVAVCSRAELGSWSAWRGSRDASEPTVAPVWAAWADHDPTLDDSVDEPEAVRRWLKDAIERRDLRPVLAPTAFTVCTGAEPLTAKAGAKQGG